MKDNDFVQIDENRLDYEWVRQPGLYHEWALKVAEAKERHAQAKVELDLVRAELDHEIRTHPSRYNLEKVTETVVETTTIRQKEYQVALAVMNKAKYEMDVFQAAVEALDHKKKALENLVSLRLSDYFSEPKAPKGRRDEVSEMEMKALRRKGQKKCTRSS